MIIQCDFDGTITSNNLSVLLRDNFARGDWQKIEADYLQGRITVEQSNRLQYAMVKESREKLQEFVGRHIEVKPGFPKFVRYCRDSGLPLVIVSSGLDFYIKTVLDQIGMSDLELYCGQASFGEDGITVTYYAPEGDIISQGFKKKYLDWLRQRDSNIVYIGDGPSDLEAARSADRVFATGRLLGLLSNEPVVSSEFSDFHDLMRQLRLLG